MSFTTWIKYGASKDTVWFIVSINARMKPVKASKFSGSTLWIFWFQEMFWSLKYRFSRRWVLPFESYITLQKILLMYRCQSIFNASLSQYTEPYYMSNIAKIRWTRSYRADIQSIFYYTGLSYRSKVAKNRWTRSYRTDIQSIFQYTVPYYRSKISKTG